MNTALLKRLFTVSEYHRMAEAGILGECDRVELLEGEVVTMSPISPKHAAVVNRLNRLFFRRLPDRAIVSVQNPIGLGELSEPHPDLALLRPRDDFYAQDLPSPGDIRLLVEVAESSAQAERDFKLGLYARYGVPEVWLVDVDGQILEAFAQPQSPGYAEVQHYDRGQTVTPTAFPDVAIAVEEVLGR